MTMQALTDGCPQCTDTIAYAKRVGAAVRCDGCDARYAPTKGTARRAARDDERAWDRRERAMRNDLALVARWRAHGSARCGLGGALTGGPPTKEQRKHLGGPSWAYGSSAPSPALVLPGEPAEVGRDYAAEQALARGREYDARLAWLATEPALSHFVAVLEWVAAQRTDLEGDSKTPLDVLVGRAFATSKQLAAWDGDRAFAAEHGRPLLRGAVAVWQGAGEAQAPGRTSVQPVA